MTFSDFFLYYLGCHVLMGVGGLAVRFILNLASPPK
jgi:hypothetical protein